MSTIVSSKKSLKTISIRLPLEIDQYLEFQAHKESRSKSNYIKNLIKKAMDYENIEYQTLLNTSKSFGSMIEEADGDEDLYSVKDVKPLKA